MAVGRYIPGLMVLGAILAAYKIFDLEEIFNEFIKRELEESYDFIIVGGGTSGAVLASRITEDKDLSVLLVESGGDPYGEQNIDIPIMADVLRGTEWDFGYKTTPQKTACKSHEDQSASFVAGRGLGGTSNLNYLLYLRGSRHDYDDWANNGAQGWGYKDVLPYFIKSEDQRNGEHVRTVFHGFGGRLTVSDISLSPVNRILETAFKDLGIKKRDINGRNHFGFSNVQATVRNGQRWGTYKAFLRRATDRPNLHILTKASAQKIVFEGRKAVGVQILHEDTVKVIKANKEVVLSAGVVGSTKLLLLSGVGPRAHLHSLKIPVVSDVPVGENLQDHVMADPIEYYSPFGGLSLTAAKAENFMSSWSYSLFGTGMKQSPRFREALAYVKTRYQPPHIKYPLIALYFVANVDTYDASQLNVKEAAWNAIHGDRPSKEGFTVFPVLLHPRSRGNIRLQSSNPEDDVLVNPNYLSEDADVKILSEAYQFARKLGNTKSLQDWELSVNSKLLPQCERLGNYTNAYVECFLKHITLPGNSMVGTCRMGAAGDPSAVVDPNLKVRGVKNLRVVDASVIPNSLSGDTYATQVMIAEKAADMLREKDTVKAIKDYFKHLIAVKHKRIVEETGDEDAHTGVDADPNAAAGGATAKNTKQGKKKAK